MTGIALSGSQKRYLKGLAHNLKPVVWVGQNGVNAAMLEAVNAALDTHELIKVKFTAFKQKHHKQRLCREIVDATQSHHIGLTGHVLILFRSHADPTKRRISLPGPVAP